MTKNPIFSKDLQFLLQKKIELLRQWFELAQRQFTSIDSSSLATILRQKDDIIQQLEQTDNALSYWHTEHSRRYTESEEKLLSGIEQALQNISQSEEQFQGHLQKQLHQVSGELQRLSQQEQARRYFKTQAKAGKVGRLLRLKQ